MFTQLINSARSRSHPWPSWRYLWITVPWLIGICFFASGMRSNLNVAPRQAIAQGSVFALDLPNHMQSKYGFEVGGKHFEGSGSIYPIPRLGDSVRVYYDPLDPTDNSLQDFGVSAWTAIGPITFMATGILILTTAIAFAKYQRRPRPRTP